MSVLSIIKKRFDLRMFSRSSNLFLALIFVFGAIPIHAKTDAFMIKGSSLSVPVQRSKKVRLAKRRSAAIWPTHLSSRQVQSIVRQALVLTKKPLSWQKSLVWLAFRESTDRPFATAWEGIGNEYALGLMQMLPSTFREHAMPRYTDIWNPVDNTVAAIRYISSRYENPWNIPSILTNSYQGY